MQPFDITQRPTNRIPAAARRQFMQLSQSPQRTDQRQFFEEETLSVRVVQTATVLTRAQQATKKWQKVGEYLSVVFAATVVIMMLLAMLWTGYVTLRCNYCCSGPPLVPPYGIPGPK